MGTVTHLPSYLGHMEETGTVKFENLWYFFYNLFQEGKYLSRLRKGLRARFMHLPSPRTTNNKWKMSKTIWYHWSAHDLCISHPTVKGFTLVLGQALISFLIALHCTSWSGAGSASWAPVYQTLHTQCMLAVNQDLPLFRDFKEILFGQKTILSFCLQRRLKNNLWPENEISFNENTFLLGNKRFARFRKMQGCFLCLAPATEECRWL